MKDFKKEIRSILLQSQKETITTKDAPEQIFKESLETPASIPSSDLPSIKPKPIETKKKPKTKKTKTFRAPVRTRFRDLRFKPLKTKTSDKVIEVGSSSSSGEEEE